MKLVKITKRIELGNLRIVVCGQGKNKSAASGQLNRKLRMLQIGADRNHGSLRV